MLFDPDYTSKRIQVDLTNVDLYDALRIIGTISGTFWRPITANTIFVAQNTRAKRTELDEEAVQTFYLTNVAQQNDFTDLQTALRNMFQTAKIYGVASQNAIIMRGTPDELLLAQKLIDDLDKAKPEVVVDVAVLEVSRNYERTIGIQLPQTATVNLPGVELQQHKHFFIVIFVFVYYNRAQRTTTNTSNGLDAEQSCASERDQLCGHHRAGDGQSAADGQRDARFCRIRAFAPRTGRRPR